MHGITGSLGWGLAPAMLVPIALAFSWQAALASAGVLIFVVLGILVLNRDKLTLPVVAPVAAKAQPEGNFDFLKIPAVWMCFGFFFFYAIVISVVQIFAPEAARHLHAVPVAMAALCLTVYMVCSAGGMVLGGFLVADPARAEKIVGFGFGGAAVFALALGLVAMPSFVVPVLFGFMGFVSGIAGPSRDMLVKKSAPDNATGRVYGVVYSGLDIGQAVAPLFFGLLMDNRQYSAVFIGLAVVQGVLIASAFRVRKVRRTVSLAPA